MTGSLRCREVERLTLEHMAAAATRLVSAVQQEADERARALRRRRDGARATR